LYNVAKLQNKNHTKINDSTEMVDVNDFREISHFTHMFGHAPYVSNPNLA
jgi:hypothetical protein